MKRYYDSIYALVLVLCIVFADDILPDSFGSINYVVKIALLVLLTVTTIEGYKTHQFYKEEQ